jgi:hypothetical protein
MTGVTFVSLWELFCLGISSNLILLLIYVDSVTFLFVYTTKSGKHEPVSLSSLCPSSHLSMDSLTDFHRFDIGEFYCISYSPEFEFL